MSSVVTQHWFSYGKINWYLDVLDKRADGFTNIETVFQSVSLHDTLAVTPHEATLLLTCSDDTLEVDESNLVMRAARLLQTHCNCTQGATLHLEKRIPIAAGLAGGSGNAAATLVALNEVWHCDLELNSLMALGAQLGSDVPFCMMGGTAAASGRGEILTPLDPVTPQWLVLANPGIPLTAREVYTHPALTRNTASFTGPHSPGFDAALESLNNIGPSAMLFNRMEGPVFSSFPAIEKVRDDLLTAGCSHALMSGSGSTCFGLCANEDQANAVAAQLHHYRCFTAHTVNQGVSKAP